MKHKGDKATLDIADVKVKADILIENNGGLPELKVELENALNL
jgi:hypothetical protein